jgi:hypothetical protein
MRGYRVRVYDNVHPMDEGEAYDLGPFATAEEALEVARRIVRESVRSCAEGCETLAEVMRQYKAFGEDPVVIGNPSVTFSAWDYAQTIATLDQQTFDSPV